MTDPIPTWRQCYDAGMTAPEAAKARGSTRNAAHCWASSRNVFWAKKPKADVKALIVAAENGMTLADAAAKFGISRQSIADKEKRYDFRFVRPSAEYAERVAALTDAQSMDMETLIKVGDYSPTEALNIATRPRVKVTAMLETRA